jgi:hypothetical protein
MSTTTTTTTYSFLSLSLLGGFSFFNRNLLSLFVFRLFASLVDLYCRSRPLNEIQKTFSFHSFGYFWWPTAVSLRKEKTKETKITKRNEGQSVLCSLAKSVPFVWFAHPRANPMTPVKRTSHRRIVRRKTSPAPKQRLDHTLKGPLKIIARKKNRNVVSRTDTQSRNAEINKDIGWIRTEENEVRDGKEQRLHNVKKRR